MSYRSTMILLCVLVLHGFLVPFVGAQTRGTLNLDGEWSFATDPDNRGEAEKWHRPEAKLPAMPLPGYAPAANGKIHVPGVWDNQGYGVENQKVRHNFIGKGWYKRQIEIPRSWAGRRAFLVITGVHRYGKVWINDFFLGEHVGCLSTREYDVTPFVAPGKLATITIQVDSKQRWKIDAMVGASSLSDYMDIKWGGIWGHVFLESRSDVWLSDLFIQPDVVNSNCTASATVNGNAGLANAANLEIFDKNGRRLAVSPVKLTASSTGVAPLCVKARIPNAELWSPDSPTLYTARITLMNGEKDVDVVENRFGMRQFTVDGFRLLLNGKRIMLRGYGDDHVYPEQMAMPSDKELHLKRLRLIKSYGFNHVRHHSTIMPPEYYDACDEIGMIVTAEFPIGYGLFVPGSGATWKSRVPPDTDPTAALEVYKREWASAIMRHRNHPSILCWVMGNELWDGLPLRFDFQRIAHEADPKRFFADSDGLYAYVNADGLQRSADRDTTDILFTMFAVRNNPIDNPAKYRTDVPKKPIISHEAGNYVTFSRPDLAEQFQNNVKPFWLTDGKAKLERLGLLDEADQWAEKSERLYLLCNKYEIESLRSNPCLSGYHWWLFQDYWTSSNGIVDHYFRPKSITKEMLLKFNGPVVLLQDGVERTYRGQKRLALKLLASNFSPELLQGALSYEVTAGDAPICRQQTPLPAVSQGHVTEIARISAKLPNVVSPVKLKIAAKIVAGEKQFANDWTAWLYPPAVAPNTSVTPIFADETQIERFPNWNLKPIASKGELSRRAVYVVSWPCDSRVVDAMSCGAAVVVLGGAGKMMKSYPITFRTSWWKAGDSPATNHAGTFVHEHPATRAMAPDAWCDDGWFYLLEGAVKCVLESAPARPTVIVRALPSMALVEDDALLFEVGVGNGVLIVSGLNHQHANGRPENEWIVARLLDYASEFPRPKVRWPASFVSPTAASSAGFDGKKCFNFNYHSPFIAFITSFAQPDRVTRYIGEPDSITGG